MHVYYTVTSPYYSSIMPHIWICLLCQKLRWCNRHTIRFTYGMLFLWAIWLQLELWKELILTIYNMKLFHIDKLIEISTSTVSTSGSFHFYFYPNRFPSCSVLWHIHHFTNNMVASVLVLQPCKHPFTLSRCHLVQRWLLSSFYLTCTIYLCCGSCEI